MFTDYRGKLLNILTVSNNLSHYFVSQKIISVEDYATIVTSSLPQVTARILLDSMSSHLLNGNDAMFSKMLSVMKEHGVQAVKDISLEIISKLSSMKSVDDMTGI